MLRSTHFGPVHRALTFRALRTAIVGASLFSLACSAESHVPFKPADLAPEDFDVSADVNPNAPSSGLVANTAQLVRLVTDTTRCLGVPEQQSAGTPVIVAKCGSNAKMLLKYTTAGEIRTSANTCIGAQAKEARTGSPVTVVPCDGKAGSRWKYDAAQHLANGAGGCLTVAGVTLTNAAKTQLGTCVTPAPWSQRVVWNTPGTPVNPTPPTPTPTPTPPAGPPPNPTVASVRVSPAANTLVKGDSLRLTPTAYNSAGQVVPASFTWSVASGNSAVSVSATGVVKALNVGSATIAARAAGFIGTASVTVTSVSTPPTTPTPSPPPPAGAAPSIAPTRPLSTVDVSWRAPTGKSIVVHAGDNLQTALNNAQRGDEIVIDAGATFTGNFTLPAKSGAGWIIVRTSALSSLPPLGSRVTPSHASAMPKLVASGLGEALRTATGANGWRIVGLEITVPQSQSLYYVLVSLGDGSLKQSQTSQVPYDLILDRVYIHGQSKTNMQRCVALNSARSAIIGSQLLECHGRGYDSQAIGGWNGPGPYLIENNRLEAAGEVIMFGGADPAIPNLIPSDVTISRNYLYKPMGWKGVWTVKNLFELKNAQRVLVEGNVMENNWVDGQIGFAVALGTVNQDGRCSWCVVQDVTMRFNHIHNAAGGFTILEQCGLRSPGGSYTCNAPVAQPTRRIALQNNLLTSIGASGLGPNGRMFQLLDGLDDLMIENNTGFAPQTYIELNQFTKYKNRFTFRNNIGGGAAYNLRSSEGLGTAALAKHLAPPYQFAGNVFVGTSVQMPTGNSYAASQTLLGLTNALGIGGIWSLLPSSPYNSVGMGGASPGLNWANFASMTANVRF